MFQTNNGIASTISTYLSRGGKENIKKIKKEKKQITHTKKRGLKKTRKHRKQ